MCHILEPTLPNFLCIWANFHCWKWPNIEQIIEPSGHTSRQETVLLNILQIPRYTEGRIIIPSFESQLANFLDE